VEALAGRRRVKAGHVARHMMGFCSALGWLVWKKQVTAARAAYMASLPLVCVRGRDW
jgi:hypothetical protein